MWSNPYHLQNLPVSLGMGASDFLSPFQLDDSSTYSYRTNKRLHTARRTRSSSIYYTYSNRTSRRATIGKSTSEVKEPK